MYLNSVNILVLYIIHIYCILWTNGDTKCSYSFVVNEYDPSACPCLLQGQPGAGNIAGVPAPPGVNNEQSHVTTKSKRSPTWQADPTQASNEVPLIGENKLDYDGLPIKLADPDPEKNFNSVNKLDGQMKYEFNKLTSTMKDLELKVYQESVQNRELKNIVIKQEQSLKDYKYLVEKLKSGLVTQKVTLSKEKENLANEIELMKRSLNIVQETLGKQDFHISTLQKTAHYLTMKISPDVMFKKDKAFANMKNKIIPVQATSDVICDGLSKNSTSYKDCEELYERGHKTSGVYYIRPLLTPCPIPVYCDMGTNGTGWIVIQRRIDGQTEFNRNWDEYRAGFGNLNHEFWLGNNNIFLFTNQASYRLRIDMWDFNNTHQYAQYLYFNVAGERDKYRLLIHNFSGTVPDAFYRHNGMMFSTKDEDNDGWKDYHCAQEWAGGWWFNNCWYATMNGRYYDKPDVKYRGISWNEWKHEQLKRVEMKITPSDVR